MTKVTAAEALPRIQELAREVLGAFGAEAPETCASDKPLYELGFDSLDVAVLIMGLEDEFGLAIDDEASSEFSDESTLEDVSKLIARLTGAT